MKATDAAGAHVADLSLASAVGTAYHVEWVPVPDRDARSTPTRRQLGDGDVTRSRKLEGTWWAGAGRASRDVEFTGPVYAPDGRILFANIQEPGYLFAITGPWREHRS